MMTGYQIPARRDPKPEYTTWTYSQLESAARAIDGIARYRRQLSDGVPLPAVPVSGEWVIVDPDGVRHHIYMDRPTEHQEQQANFTPLPTVHKIPETDFGVHESHDMKVWKGFRKLHRKCVRCGAFTDRDLTFECEFPD